MRALIFALFFSLGMAESEPRPIAFKGAKIVVSPGKTIDGTVVVRHGLIESVGEVAIPADCEVIDGQGLFIYAGFIDAHTQIGLPDTKRTPDQQKAVESESPDFTKEALGGMQEANRKGIRPELNASDLFAPTADIKRWQAAGFTAALVAPTHEYVSGTSALVTLSGAPRRDALVQTPIAMHLSFATYGDGYPSTLMGSIAQIRQFLFDVITYHGAWQAYRKEPTGRPRPPHDAALEAAVPILTGDLPVIFSANSENDIRRVIKLADEFKLKLIISGGTEAFKLADLLKQKEVPVILSLALPKEPEKKKKKDDDRPEKYLKEEQRLWEEKMRAAVALDRAGVRFCFTMSGNPSDTIANLQKLVERGLSRESALRALTTAPADLFGVSKQLGTIEAGKIADLTVLTAPIGDKSCKVRYVVVDGRKIEFDAKKVGGAPPEIDLTGTWNVTGRVEGTLELKQSGADVTGTLKTRRGEAPVTGSVSGKKFELTATFTARGKTVEQTLSGEMNDKELKGTVKTPQGEGEFTATKPENSHD